ncbi:hypothetical protein BDC45DRAFT_568540 [Circinella umbellata]|nr:hypothetical protein BDC45DRAFT_568540 [Circinella umbellata]
MLYLSCISTSSSGIVACCMGVHGVVVADDIAMFAVTTGGSVVSTSIATLRLM